MAARCCSRSFCGLDALGVGTAQQHRAQAPRRRAAGGADLDGAAVVREFAAARLFLRSRRADLVHGRLLRGDVGPDDDRRHGPDRPRHAAAVGQPVALLPAVARRHGHPRAGRRDPADARHGRQPAVPGRDGRSAQGCQAHAAHHRDRQGAVDDLRLPVAAVPAGLPRRWHELVRRLGAHVRHHQPRRHEQPRRKLRPLQFAVARMERGRASC